MCRDNSFLCNTPLSNLAVGCMWLELEEFERIMEFSRKLFPVVSFAYSFVPS